MVEYPYVPYIPLREEDLQSPTSESQDLQPFEEEGLQSQTSESQVLQPFEEEDLQSPTSKSQVLQPFQEEDPQSQLDESQFEHADVERNKYEYKPPTQDEDVVVPPFDYRSLLEEVVPDTPDRLEFEARRSETMMKFDEELATLTLMFFETETPEERSARYEADPEEVARDILRIHFPGFYPLPEYKY